MQSIITKNKRVETRDTLDIPTIKHLTKPVPNSMSEDGEPKIPGHNYSNTMLIVYGTSLKNMENPGIGPQHERITIMLSWGKKA